MTFLQMYGDAIDTELGSADRTQRFTSARRKLETNNGQREFVRLTGCYVRRAAIALTDNVGEYDLVTLVGEANFFRLTGADQLPVIKRTISAVVDYIAGENDFPRRTPDWLDRFEPGWRTATKGTPTAWYTRQEEGDLFIGATPPPKIAGGDTWSLLTPYVAYPDTMVADADEPFSTGAPTLTALLPYHQALVHYASGKLELLRRNYPASDRQMQLFAGFVAEYLESRRIEGPQHVVLARDYLGDANQSRATLDLGDPRR